MPRPPTLPEVDWRKIFATGRSYVSWLESAESSAQAATMKDWTAQQQLTPHAHAVLSELARDVYIVAFAEDWCGDVVRHVPVLEKLAGSSPRIHTAYLTRSEDPALFSRCLTNGGEAVPKFIFMSESFVECGNWGPMAAACREWIARGKALGNVGAARKKVSQLYAADPHKHEVIDELVKLIEIATTASI